MNKLSSVRGASVYPIMVSSWKGRRVGARPNRKQDTQPSKTVKATLRQSLSWIASVVVALSASSPASALTPAETTSLLYLKQEEKLARDVYQSLAARWDLQVFRNIALSEQRHVDAVDALIVRFGLADTTPAEPGRFSIPELQKLHDDLMTQAQASATAALQVGVSIEETDIADLEEALSSTSDPALRRVLANLLRGSTNHLGAFQSLLASVDATGNVACASTSCPKEGACMNGGRQGMGRRNGARAESAKAGCTPGNPATCPKAPTCTEAPCTTGATGTSASGPSSAKSPVTPAPRGRR
jgi:hypothetical protein